MVAFILRRLVALLSTMFLVTLIVFFLIWQLPAEDRLQVYIPNVASNIAMNPAKLAQFEKSEIARRGLDDPFPVQYVYWITHVLVGDWGFSPVWGQGVLPGILSRAPATAELAIAAMIPSLGLAIVLGKLSAQHRNRLSDYAIRGAAFAAWGFPPYILALMLLNVFYVNLGWFPPGQLTTSGSIAVLSPLFRSFTGMYLIDSLLNGNLTLFLDSLQHLVLPATVLALAQWALFTRVLRSSLIAELGQDYVTMARAKGLPERAVVGVHAWRNAIIPVISVGTTAVSLSITNIAVVEIIFNFNGLARSATLAMLQLDVPVAVGATVFTCLVTVLSSFIGDILYGLFDPRVRAV